MKKKMSLIMFSAFLMGCSTVKKDDPVIVGGLDKVANDVYSELRKLNDINGRKVTPPVASVSGCTSKIVSLDFDGDIMLFVEDLKKVNLCDIRLVGKKPQQDLILSLHHQKVPLWQVLEDASVQLGVMASITVGERVVVIQLNGGAHQ